MEINLISDTVTKPTPAMLDVMFKAEVGDDVFKQDPTVNELERYTAEMFGKEAALFFPSGTMANQTAIKLHTQPGDEVICDKWSHIFLYEGGGVAANSGVSCHLVDGDRGKITAEQVKNVINDPEFYHAPTTRLVSLENTTNKGGGACYEFQELQKIKQVCIEHNLKYHLDGARLWNALVAKQQQPKDFGSLFDTISVCLSKGLGAPVGSVLVGNAIDIKKAIRIRKLFGGNMRQSGYLAAAGLYALQNNIERLAQDHQRAKELGKVLASKSWIASVEPVETNIVIFTLHATVDEKQFIEKLKQKSILISSMGQGKLRMVTHMDYRSVMHDYVLDVLNRMQS
ncbi:threonine aldolase [Flavobacterium sp. 316]|uniref:Beta-eliminating lyase-related protein n=1 Tax=Flavobacterium sediminilitoris TaxID=2024526 RepID=A0ABY4HQ92_9FLAO|nr:MULTISPECIES: GntG family PLP-dependent aldolase [Flavobacterium]KIX22377.1 threonine aldolase [Flavobacterium sp. 316]UOX33684.1 beta-eliminating lyase-related protein [Flavobacterium sediminilitoris]